MRYLRGLVHENLRNTFNKALWSPKYVRPETIHACLKPYSTNVNAPDSWPIDPAMLEFNATNLDKIQQRLETRLSTRPPFTFKYDTSKTLAEAAVLVPFCIVDGKPSILFTVRSSNMNSHKGEVSFPGGKKDPEDKSLLATALRETHEEVYIPSEDIQTLGQHATLPNRTLTMKVYPFVGFIKKPIVPQDVKYNPHEVSGVFTLTLEQLLDPKRRSLKKFRGMSYSIPVFKGPEELGVDVWGLTAFILEGVLKTSFQRID
ncbi:hypothetical protein K7432_004450 [Basidiobolus ranarum]|uniref:Nudix hydrolase domain-containing protein n=1 Tax=Basidiobolus ranarum TaxID=34480 RepID=A0ABR2W4M2_9FUNG